MTEPAPPTSIVARWFGRAVDAQPQELRALLLSALYFFALLCSYYILRPLREEMGIAGGVEQLHWVFTATLVAMFATVPLFGWLTARFARRRFLPIVYLFFIANLLIFYAAFQLDTERVWVARAFFVWVSVFNLFVVSVFWSFMVDLFNREQARRFFGFIAAGGSLGAVAGPLLTTVFAAPLGPVNLLLVSAAWLALAVLCIVLLGRDARAAATEEQAIGGGVLEGLVALTRSPYLLGIAFFVIGLTVVATFYYFEQAHVVRGLISSSAERTVFFARIDLIVNVIAVSLQVFATGRLMRWLGLTSVLALMPLLSAAGLLWLAAAPALGVLGVVQVARRAGEYALTRPAREVLFAALPRSEKYKAKNVIDTLVYRAGDALGGWLFALLLALGLGLGTLAWLGAGIALVWFGVALWLGRAESRRTDSPR